jgi:hypothetical protein
MPCAVGSDCPGTSHCRDGFCARGRLSDVGETCVTNSDCDTGLCAVSPGGSSRCVEPCTPEGTCSPGLVCVDGNCWPEALRPGDACVSTDDACDGGTCVDLGGDIICVTSCTTPADCTSGLACVGVGDGTAGVCLPPSVDVGDGDGDGDGGGCDCAVPGPAGTLASALLALGGLLALRVRLTRRRGPR